MSKKKEKTRKDPVEHPKKKVAVLCACVEIHGNNGESYGMKSSTFEVVWRRVKVDEEANDHYYSPNVCMACGGSGWIE